MSARNVSNEVLSTELCIEAVALLKCNLEIDLEPVVYELLILADLLHALLLQPSMGLFAWLLRRRHAETVEQSAQARFKRGTE